MFKGFFNRLGLPTNEERLTAALQPRQERPDAREVEMAQWTGRKTESPVPVAQELPSDPFSAEAAPENGEWSKGPVQEEAGNDSLAA